MIKQHTNTSTSVCVSCSEHSLPCRVVVDGLVLLCSSRSNSLEGEDLVMVASSAVNCVGPDAPLKF